MKTNMLVLLTVTLTLLGCSSRSWQNAQHSTGLLEYLADETGHSGKSLPVEIAPQNTPHIAVARARVNETRKSVLVSGSARLSAVQAAHHHVDVALIGANQNILAATAAKFTRTNSYPRLRGGLPDTSYAVNLPILPPAGSSIRVSYHAASISKCPLDHS